MNYTSDITIHVHGENGRVRRVDASPAVTVEDLIRELVIAGVLAKSDSKGHQIHCVLLDEDAARPLDVAKSLQENGVRDGHHLYAQQLRPRPEKTIRLRIHTQGGETHTEEISLTVTTEEFINDLVGRLQLPVTDPRGQKIIWRLVDKETGKALEQGKTLEENEVKDGHHFGLLPKVAALPIWTRIWESILKRRQGLVPLGIAVALIGMAVIVTFVIRHVMAKIPVEVRTSPSGANVLINGKDLGTSPIKAELRAGTYRIEARKVGYEPTVKTVNVSLVRTLAMLRRGFPPIDLVLVPSPRPPDKNRASLWLSTTLSGTIQLDHETPKPHQAGGTFERQQMAEGSHTVVFSGTDGQTVTFNLTTIAGAAPEIGNPVVPKAMVATFVTSWKGQAQVHYSSQDNVQVSLQLDSNPAIQNVSPTGLNLADLAQGNHMLMFRARGQQWIVPIEIGPAPALAAFIERLPNAGTLVIATPGVDSVQVFVNNVSRGLTGHERLVVQGLLADEYTVRVAKDGYSSVPATRAVRIVGGATRTVAFHLTPLPPSLSVRHAVPDTRVFLDGQLVGTADAAGNFSMGNVSPGLHTIRLDYTQYQPERIQRSFVAGQTVVVLADQRQLGLVILNTAPNPSSMKFRQAGESQDHAVHPGAAWLLPGSYTFTAYWDNRSCSKQAVVTAGGQVTLNFRPACD